MWGEAWDAALNTELWIAPSFGAKLSFLLAAARLSATIHRARLQRHQRTHQEPLTRPHAHTPARIRSPKANRLHPTRHTRLVRSFEVVAAVPTSLEGWSCQDAGNSGKTWLRHRQSIRELLSTWSMPKPTLLHPSGFSFSLHPSSQTRVLLVPHCKPA